MTFGALISPYDIRDYKINKVAKSVSFPEEYELPYTPEVKDQKSVNSCVAHVCASIAEYYENQQCEVIEELSPGYIYGVRYDYKGEGMYLRDALKTLCDKGICKHSDFPYNKEVPEIIDLVNEANLTEDKLSHYRITKYFRCKTADDIKNAIMTFGPVMVSVPWYSDNKVQNDILIQGRVQSGNHALYLYGWNTDGFLSMNSWGKGWAEDGKCILPFNYPLNEAWGITDEYTYAHDEMIVEPKRNWFLDLIYKIVNWIVNLFKGN